MADTGRKFSDKELSAYEKSGVLGFIAQMTGHKDVAELRAKGFILVKATGQRKLAATYSVSGRTTIKGNVKKLTMTQWADAVDHGAAKVLSEALGHGGRLGVLERERGIKQEKVAKVKATTAKVQKTARPPKASAKSQGQTPEEKRAEREAELAAQTAAEQEEAAEEEAPEQLEVPVTRELVTA